MPPVPPVPTVATVPTDSQIQIQILDQDHYDLDPGQKRRKEKAQDGATEDEGKRLKWEAAEAAAGEAKGATRRASGAEPGVTTRNPRGDVSTAEASCAPRSAGISMIGGAATDRQASSGQPMRVQGAE